MQLFCFASSAAAVPVDQAGSRSDYRYPVIESYGGIVDPLGTAELPRENAKVVYDIKSGEMDNGVIKGLDRAAQLINLYVAAGLKTKDLQMAIVLHGEATKAAMVDSAYRKHFDGQRQPEPRNYPTARGKRGGNLRLSAVLGSARVQPEGNPSGSDHCGFCDTVNINKQMDGYAYLPFH